ncbi:putative hydrolase of the HAD superfamily [Clostridium tetanomorphum]|uniref:Noncanonical pyrimidine nucleotidase, YjjG family n=1 Tax=Clostridium tetanomorphum TaxID=1553 RepID=A0A923ECB2_CLOTT|nr:YjjG family noncanonical pyrimidine nucleotidase [Clostridium tetanomorphum]KAJ51677.1 HAD superfamily hydrolase [Clostridium tetanomorphum DSM 665]KAJ51957.1 HAD superfamily hydrolase [Clostridium tetanomorphum DSM 665]MBC2398686.1 noncanonical pyrimidine nucleotidase, YjjG family [Clostridium tetanomorphum]MBP1864033.1 putative hydrolase of the HAD superfamily [Clostridium tetanomorphum]NRS84446.1 putative hydrolase of the HAD superfamily [Clostridium tetanomorphum]
MKYEIIIFDADETLFDFKKSEEDAFKNTMLEFNMNYDENYHLKIYREINTTIWKEMEDGLITQKELNVERFKRLSRKLNIKFNQVEFAKSYIKRLSCSSFLYDDSICLLESLYKDYKLFIITNGITDVQDNRIRKSTISKYFEDIIISEEAPVSKPDSKIFEYALNNIKYTDKSKVLMVGDSLTSDIQGGINFGIDTCWFNPNKIINNTEIKPTYEISNLMELKDILKR